MDRFYRTDANRCTHGPRLQGPGDGRTDNAAVDNGEKCSYCF